MLVWEKVRNYLDESGIKQTTLAKKTGLSYGTLNAILNGERTMYAEDLRLVCQALNVPPEKFIEFEPNDST